MGPDGSSTENTGPAPVDEVLTGGHRPDVEKLFFWREVLVLMKGWDGAGRQPSNMFYMNFFLSLSSNMESVCPREGCVCFILRSGSFLAAIKPLKPNVCVCVCVCVCEQDHVGQEGPPAGWFLANPSGRGPEPTEPQPLQISESSLHHQDRLLQRGSQEHQGAGTSSAGSGPAGRLLLSGRVWFCYHIIWLDYQ